MDANVVESTCIKVPPRFADDGEAERVMLIG